VGRGPVEKSHHHQLDPQDLASPVEKDHDEMFLAFVRVPS
jgi:hypothetical protein